MWAALLWIVLTPVNVWTGHLIQEGGVRGIGFVCAGKGVGLQKVGYENTALMHVTDWLPTLCEVAGCNLNGTKPLDGVSAWGSISADK